MGYGFGYHYRVPQAAKDVAKAFYAGRSCKRTNCETDGRNYFLEGNIIARRVPEEEQAAEAAMALLGQDYRRPLEFSFAGWPTEMTCRHLIALGVQARIETQRQYGPRGGVLRGMGLKVPLMNGVKVAAGLWYSPEELKAMPRWQEIPPQVSVCSVPARQPQLALEFAA